MSNKYLVGEKNECCDSVMQHSDVHNNFYVKSLGQPVVNDIFDF